MDPELLCKFLSICDSGKVQLHPRKLVSIIVVPALKFDDLNNEKGSAVFESYFHSKLANMLFNRELSKRLKGSYYCLSLRRLCLGGKRRIVRPSSNDTEKQTCITTAQFACIHISDRMKCKFVSAGICIELPTLYFVFNHI